MGVVAVAGGTGDVGRTIVEQLVRSGKHKVVVLSRKVPDSPDLAGPEFLAANYADVEATARALETLGVDTVISGITPHGPGEEGQLNLIAAAEKSSVTKRFLPSDFGPYMPDDKTPEEVDPMAAPALRAALALKKTTLEYTHVSNGIFMDYFGHPNVPSHLRSFRWAVNFAERRAAIPGTGDERISLTYSKDVARFVDRLLDEDKWPRDSIVCGSDTSINEIVAIAERVTGEKFDVAYDSIEKLREGKATLVFPPGETYGGTEPEVEAAWIGVTAVEGQLALPKEGRLNEKFPEIVPMSIEEMITQAWGKK